MWGGEEWEVKVGKEGYYGLGREGEMIVDCLRVGEKGEELKV